MKQSGTKPGKSPATKTGTRRTFYLTEKEVEQLNYLTQETGFKASTILGLALRAYYNDFRQKDWSARSKNEGLDQKVDRPVLEDSPPRKRED